MWDKPTTPLILKPDTLECVQLYYSPGQRVFSAKRGYFIFDLQYSIVSVATPQSEVFGYCFVHFF